jgi:hypothetical protein
MTPTFMLDSLLTCLRTAPTSEQIAQLSTLSPATWDEIAAMAKRQKVESLLYYRLKAHGLEHRVPVEITACLKKHYYANAARNLYLMQEVDQILTALQQAQIAVIVLKGVHLATTIYASPGLRYMADIDLVVHEAQLAAATRALNDLGYRTRKEAGPASAAEHHLVPMVRQGDMASVEIHWTILPTHHGYGVEMDKIWAQAQTITIANQQTFVLSPEDLLLHVCIHATYFHLFQQGVRALCDVDAIIRHCQSTLNWQEVIALGKTRQWAKGLYLTLYLAQQWLDTPIPSAFLRALKPADFHQRIIQEAAAQIYMAGEDPHLLSPNFIHLWNTGRPVEKVQIFFRRLFLPEKTMTQLYHVAPDSPTRWFYYLIRCRELLIRYGTILWRLWGSEPRITTQIHQQSALFRWFEQP